MMVDDPLCGVPSELENMRTTNIIELSPSESWFYRVQVAADSEETIGVDLMKYRGGFR